MSDQNTQPLVTVVSGSPTPEELAAIITVLYAAGDRRSHDAPRGGRPRVGGWKSYTRTLRHEIYPGPGAWLHTRH